MTEESRATEYRRMMRARTRNKAARERALAGSASARQELQADWQPITAAMNERDNDGGDISEADGQIFNLNPGLNV